MCWLKRTLLTLVFLLCALPVVAQGPVVEYGSPNELRGVAKVFVDTGLDAEQRNMIIGEIQKKLPRLSVVARPEDADVHLRFEFPDRQTGPVVVYPRPYPIPGSRYGEGVGTVVRLLSADRVRVLMSFRDAKSTVFEREPSVNFAREFIKVYEKANH
jgi:hypothetical protein